MKFSMIALLILSSSAFAQDKKVELDVLRCRLISETVLHGSSKFPLGEFRMPVSEKNESSVTYSVDFKKSLIYAHVTVRNELGRILVSSDTIESGDNETEVFGNADLSALAKGGYSAGGAIILGKFYDRPNNLASKIVCELKPAFNKLKN